MRASFGVHCYLTGEKHSAFIDLALGGQLLEACKLASERAVFVLKGIITVSCI